MDFSFPFIETHPKNLACIPNNDFQEEMRSALNTLQEKLEVFDKMKRGFESTVEHIKVRFFLE